MKKKIALLSAAVMVVGSLPMTAFASSDNYVSSIQTVEDGDDIDAKVFIEEFKGIGSANELQTVKLTLTNAKFRTDMGSKDTDTELVKEKEAAYTDLVEALEDLFDAVPEGQKVYADNLTGNGTATEVKSAKEAAEAIDSLSSFVDGNLRVGTYSGTTFTSAFDSVSKEIGAARTAATNYHKAKTAATGATPGVSYTKISDTEYMAEFYANDNTSTAVELVIAAEADGSGDATVTLEAVDSVVSSQTLKIATIAGGATTTTISGTTSIKETATKIKNIVITETTGGSIDANGTIKLKLTNGFTWAKNLTGEAATDVVVFPSDCGITDATFSIDTDDEQVAYIKLAGQSKSGKPATISLQNVGVKYDEDDVEIGDECEVTVSDAGTTKQTITVGTAADYGVAFSVEDKDLPTFYAGRYDDDTETLVVTIKEAIENSWLTDRKTKIVFPEGVEVMDVTEDDKDKIDNWDYTIDENEVTLDVDKASSGKAELDLKFELSVAADFTGDITATLTGSGVGEDQTVDVATAAAPVTIDADVNELKIDYRNTASSDIVITEADAGVLEKGKKVMLEIDNIDFDGTPTVEVESGDMKIENVKVSGGRLTFEVKTESQKEAAVIRISDIQLYMQRSLPAGEYDLKIVTSDDIEEANLVKNDPNVSGNIVDKKYDADNAIIRNYSDGYDDATGAFDVDEVTALEGYVTVVTAGRDQGDETFTTTVTVTIGADKMYAGTKEIALDVPAYISNGYTMMPVRAVTEALSGAAIVRWDDPTKTVTITFGQRVISMTVGSNVMKINGVDVAMQAQCEITDSRAFIPLRDLGYALGLNDSKIGWDDATKTAKLN